MADKPKPDTTPAPVTLPPADDLPIGLDTYAQAVDRIHAAAEKLLKLCGKEDGTAVDDNGVTRISNSAYCLRLAHRVWERMYRAQA